MNEKLDGGLVVQVVKRKHVTHEVSRFNIFESDSEIFVDIQCVIHESDDSLELGLWHWRWNLVTS